MVLPNNFYEDGDEASLSTAYEWVALIATYIAVLAFLHKKDPETLPHLWQCTKNIGTWLTSLHADSAEQKQSTALKTLTRHQPPLPARDQTSLINDPLCPLTFEGFSPDPFEQIERITAGVNLPSRKRHKTT
jgi:hypothetical protein